MKTDTSLCSNGFIANFIKQKLNWYKVHVFYDKCYDWDIYEKNLPISQRIGINSCLPKDNFLKKTRDLIHW